MAAVAGMNFRSWRSDVGFGNKFPFRPAPSGKQTVIKSSNPLVPLAYESVREKQSADLLNLDYALQQLAPTDRRSVGSSPTGHFRDVQATKAIFLAALECEPGLARKTYLDKACGVNQELRSRVETLLAQCERTDSFLQELPLDWIEGVLTLEDQDLTGRRVGSYVVRRRLGMGGMGEVWLAEDPQLARLVALKFLPVWQRANSSSAQRLLQEARAASALNHPNIITVYGTGEYEGTSYIASEWVEGENLRRKIARGPLPLPTVLDVVGQIADALAAAHARGIVHRDIKPENLMVRPDGRVKVLDFGIAKRLTPESAAAPESPAVSAVPPDLRVTQPGAILGTARYMSPEQACGAALDARSDLWSLGIVLYEMLTGEPPFTGPTASDILIAIQTQPLPLLPVKTRRHGAAALRKIVAKLLQKDPAQRYQSAAALQADLQAAGQTTPLQRPGNLCRSAAMLRLCCGRLRSRRNSG